MDKEALRQLEILKENAVDVILEQELTEKFTSSLKDKTPLRLKIGFDPTAKDIHLGHTVLLRKLRKLQDAGHIVVLIIGDFTAKIGDPSGRSLLRPILSDEEIKDNALTYTSQTFKILDRKKTEIVFNSQWYKDMKLSDFLSLLASYTIARVLERDDFFQRVKENRPLTILEIIYPLVQGYDSVMVKADIEFGGTDQKFNLLVGRHLQEVFGQKSQGVVTMPLLVGLDGTNKMSKSLGNYISITEDPKSMFGKVMSVSDQVMWEYYRLLTDKNVEDVKKMHPKEAKAALAQDIVSFYYSSDVGLEQRQEFERVFSQREIPKDMPSYKAKTNKIDLCAVLAETKMATSKNDARRLIQQSAVSIINQADPSKAVNIRGPIVELTTQELILKIGKKKFLRIIL